MHRDEGLDFSACHTFNLDEHGGLPGSHRNSCRHYMNHNLFLNVNTDLRKTHLPDAAAADIEAECEHDRWIFENEPQWQPYRKEINVPKLEGHPVKIVQQKKKIAPALGSIQWDSKC